MQIQFLFTVQTWTTTWRTVRTAFVAFKSEEKGSCKSIIITAVDLKLKLLPDLPREAPLSFGHYFKYQYKSSSTYEIFENTML